MSAKWHFFATGVLALIAAVMAVILRLKEESEPWVIPGFTMGSPIRDDGPGVDHILVHLTHLGKGFELKAFVRNEGLGKINGYLPKLLGFQLINPESTSCWPKPNFWICEKTETALRQQEALIPLLREQRLALLLVIEEE